MADHPARRGYDPAGEETGWGSPMPAEYGSLTAFLPPLDEQPLDEPAAPERGSGRRRALPRARTEPRWRTRRAAVRDAPAAPSAPPPASNGPLPTWETAAPAGAMAAPSPTAPARRARGRGVAVPVEADELALAGMPAGPEVPGGAVPVGDRPRVPRPRRGPVDPEAPDAVPMRSRRAARSPWAQSRRAIRHLDVWTVAKVSLVFYLLVLVAAVVASVMLWYLADAAGAIQSIEKSARTLFSLKTFKLHPSAVAEYTSAGGAVLAIAGTLGNILAALMYNLISDLVGGLRFDVVDEAKEPAGAVVSAEDGRVRSPTR